MFVYSTKNTNNPKIIAKSKNCRKNTIFTYLRPNEIVLSRISKKDLF